MLAEFKMTLPSSVIPGLAAPGAAVLLAVGAAAVDFASTSADGAALVVAAVLDVGMLELTLVLACARELGADSCASQAA